MRGQSLDLLQLIILQAEKNDNQSSFNLNNQYLHLTLNCVK